MKHHFDEYVLIDNIYERMRHSGRNMNVFRVSFEANSYEDWKSRFPDVTLEDIHRAVKICLANGWLESTTLGSGYNNLKPSTTGIGIAKSRFISRSAKNTHLRRVIAWCNNNQGVLAFVGLAITIAFGIIASL
jgi:hypothetical protein